MNNEQDKSYERSIPRSQQGNKYKTFISATICLSFLLILERMLCWNRDLLPEATSHFEDSWITVQVVPAMKSRVELCDSVRGRKKSFSFWKWQWKWIILICSPLTTFFNNCCNTSNVPEGYWKTKTSACSLKTRYSCCCKISTVTFLCSEIWRFLSSSQKGNISG